MTAGNRFPFTGSGRRLEGGELATRKQDFNAHVQGNGFRHTADQIDMSPPIGALGGTTVQQTLEEFTALIASSGTGFISIGNAVDGYAEGVYNMNTLTTPTLKDAFNAAFADPRLQDGGIVLLLAGTYTLTAPITVPPGMTIMGEVAGTLIVAEMAEQSMFITSSTVKQLTIEGNSGGGKIPLAVGSNTEKIRFSNLMLSDNLNGNVASGGASMLTVPMVAVRASSNVEFNNVTFIGRLNDGSVTNRPKTLYSIGTITGGSTGTTVKIDNCFFDGIKVAVNFVPGQGDKDYLTVTNSKFRTYGSEGAAGIAINSAIVSSACNITTTNNYYIGAGTITNTFLNITTTGGSAANARIVVAGISGSPSTSSLANLVENDSGVNLNTTITGNNWGNEIGSPWYIVVGGAAGTGPLGDIFGPGAIDIVIAMSHNSYGGTVIVNPGTYNVVGSSAANNFTNLKFIGNKIGKNYPVLNINITDTTLDSVGNRFIVLGNHLESLYFIGFDQLCSVRPSFNATSNTTQSAANNITIKDCNFYDVTVNFMDIGVGPFVDGITGLTKLSVDIEDCLFSLTGNFDLSIGLLMPPANIISMKNVYFFGQMYAANIGGVTYSATTFADNIYSFENVIVDLTSGGAIYTDCPGSATDNVVFLINDPQANVSMHNCQILANNTLSPVTNKIDTGIATTFYAFSAITCRSLTIDNCLFNGPTQTFTSGGVSYALPTLQATARQNARITNSRFINGGLPLQFTGTTMLNDSSFADGIYLSGNTFSNTSTTVTTTLVDLDIGLTSNTINGGHIVMIGNSFKTIVASGTIQVRHTAQTDTYNAQGIVQIYAPFCDVKFSNNKVLGQLVPPTINPYAHLSGLVINSWNTTTGVDGGEATSAHISDNRFDIGNLWNSPSSVDSSSCIWVKAPLIDIHNNYIAMNNTQGASVAGFAGCLYLDSHATSTGTYTDSMVTGNFLSRRALLGGSGNLAHGYIWIATGSTGRGTIVDNSFSDTTTDGTSKVFLTDNSADANKWIFHSNKNQTVTAFVKATSGLITNTHNGLGGDNGLLFNSYSQSDISVSVADESANLINGNTLVITSNGSGEPSSSGVSIKWRLNLTDIIPAYAHIVSIQQNCSWTSNLPNSGTDSVFLVYEQDGGTAAITSDSLHANAGTTRTLGPLVPNMGASTRLDFLQNAYIAFFANFQAATSFTLSVAPFQITFMW